MIDSHKRIAIDNGTDDIVSGCAWPAKKFNRQHFRAHARLRCSKDEYLVKKLERNLLFECSKLSQVSPNEPRDKSHSLGTVDQDSSVCEAVFYKMAHKLLKQQSFHDSPPAHSRFSTLHSRFSTLPVEVKLKILEHIPFEEAARTSILSRTSNWSEHSQVILDKLLFEERGRWIALHPTEWVNKVTKILSNHREGLIPIRKFILHIPDMQFNWALYINIWIPFLSSNGIRELSVDNWNINTFKLSSFLLECYELTRLILRNCIFKQSVEGFRNLRFLHLEKIAFGSKIVGAVTISAPSLVRSELVDCTGFQHLNIPKLENFIVASGDGMSRDDANQMRLKLGGKTIDEEEGRGRNCRSCGGCCRWREPGYRVKYVFYPGNGRKQFVFSPHVRARW
ncbi:putative FBD-associated F-box protein At5g56560 isoform X2 [Camellia sinensis]|nr:putative FBD-associated F-box protein At5g56560 isoform X2 [Camellia sinensis]XP_028079233.1 putative FBD-associated F-box protein At5g56560 isoform X2 [Camellia sinensis]